jgi:hypothetical protein
LTYTLYILYSWDMIIKLTKKEKDFLIGWLSDDIDIAMEDFITSSQNMYPPTLENLKSIMKKLTTKKRK